MNEALKIGDAVVVTRDDGTMQATTTRSEPWKLGGHTWVVLLDGIAGCYALSRVRKALSTEDRT